MKHIKKSENEINQKPVTDSWLQTATTHLERIRELHVLGLRSNGQDFVGQRPEISDFNVSNVELVTSSEAEWQKIITSLQNELERRQNYSIEQAGA
ncbi:MAG: hypothetical protein KDK41_18225 [Leptospiraceae bacterium]|nr:hypothetical protein [Leptospiraceae bacterium]